MHYLHVVCFLSDHLTLITTSNHLIRPSRMTLWLCSTHPVTWSGSGGVACKLLSQWVAVAFTSNWRHKSSAEAIATKSMSWLVSCSGTAIVTECVALSLLSALNVLNALSCLVCCRFYMPHGIYIDSHDNVWLTDVAMHQVCIILLKKCKNVKNIRITSLKNRVADCWKKHYDNSGVARILGSGS